MTFEEIEKINKTYRFKFDYNTKTSILVNTTTKQIVTNPEESNKAKIGILLSSIIRRGLTKDALGIMTINESFFKSQDNTKRAEELLDSLNTDLKTIITNRQYSVPMTLSGYKKPIDYLITSYVSTSTPDYLKDCYPSLIKDVAKENGLVVDNFEITVPQTGVSVDFECSYHMQSQQPRQANPFTQTQQNVNKQKTQQNTNTQSQQMGATASRAGMGQGQTYTMKMGTPPPKIIPTLMYKSRNLEDKIKFLQSLSFEAKKMTDFAQELSEYGGQTREDLSCVYAIIDGSRNNVADLRYSEIEKTLFEIVNLPDYDNAKNLLVDYVKVLNKAGYVPSYGTLGRALQEMDKIDSSNLDNKDIRKDFLRNALGKGNDMLQDSENICKYIKSSNNIFTPMTHDEQAKVLLKMQDNYNQFGLQPHSNTPKNYNKLINVDNIPKADNIHLEQKSIQEIEDETNLYKGYHNYTAMACPFVITGENGEKQDIWNMSATEIINNLTIAINSGDNNEIRKMRIICENMQSHFTPSYNDMAKLTMIINDYWKLNNNPDIDRAIESLRDMAKDKYKEGLSIAKFNAQRNGRCQTTYSEMVNVFKDLEAQKNLRKQAENQGYGGGM